MLIPAPDAGEGLCEIDYSKTLRGRPIINAAVAGLTHAYPN